MKFNLGKGLQSLIPNKAENVNSDLEPGARKESVFNIEVTKIKPNPYQPRLEMDPASLKELADSIRIHGMLQPLIVTKVTKETVKGEEPEYYVIAGHRRWEAAKILSLPHVPAIIRNTTSREKLELALVENIQREDLNAMEKAMAFQRLQVDFNLNAVEIAQKVGKSREAVANTIRLLNLPQEIQQAVLANQITEGHARSLIGIKDSQLQIALFRKILDKKLSVRQVEEEYRQLVLNKSPEKSAVVADPEIKKMAQQMQEFLGAKVSLIKSGLGGRMTVYFTDSKELEGVIRKIFKG